MTDRRALGERLEQAAADLQTRGAGAKCRLQVRRVIREAAALLREEADAPAQYLTVFLLRYPDGDIHSIWSTADGAQTRAACDSKWRIEPWSVDLLALPSPPAGDET